MTRGLREILGIRSTSEINKDNLVRTHDYRWFFFDSNSWREIHKSSIEIEQSVLDRHYVADFVDKLDSNVYLICFRNGVYDLRKGIFRENRPEDYLTLNTTYNYRKYEDSEQEILKVKRILKDILPDANSQERMLNFLCQCLDGSGHDINMWNGTGSNGKSTLYSLVEEAFGDYAVRQSVDFLNWLSTGKSNYNYHYERWLSMTLSRKRLVRIADLDKSERDVDWSNINKEINRKSDIFLFNPCFSIAVIANGPENSLEEDKILEFPNEFFKNPDPKNPNEFFSLPDLSKNILYLKDAFMYLLLQHYKKYFANKQQVTQ